MSSTVKEELPVLSKGALSRSVKNSLAKQGKKRVVRNSLLDPLCPVIPFADAEFESALHSAIFDDFHDIRQLFGGCVTQSVEKSKRRRLKEMNKAWMDYKRGLQKNGKGEQSWNQIRKLWKKVWKLENQSVKPLTTDPQKVIKQRIRDEANKQFCFGVNQLMRRIEKTECEASFSGIFHCVIVEETTSKFLLSSLCVACQVRAIPIYRCKNLSTTVSTVFGFSTTCLGVRIGNNETRCFARVREVIEKHIRQKIVIEGNMTVDNVKHTKPTENKSLDFESMKKTDEVLIESRKCEVSVSELTIKTTPVHKNNAKSDNSAVRKDSSPSLNPIQATPTGPHPPFRPALSLKLDDVLSSFKTSLPFKSPRKQENIGSGANFICFGTSSSESSESDDDVGWTTVQSKRLKLNKKEPLRVYLTAKIFLPFSSDFKRTFIYHSSGLHLRPKSCRSRDLVLAVASSR
ncbi:unnamed protein product [Cyprideis torosa]|uniref:Uncharacterized protein n=1 Tax=Cyprideis torosa TaxID=163714 RepID=A0A7R8WBV1_9CRUS|nr:unnamed protein product [Cyprideis torosa]CAG0892704.1 unnamed protein product [Cyprideis torosa]